MSTSWESFSCPDDAWNREQGGEILALSFGSPRGPFRMSGWQSGVTRWSSCDSDSRPLRGSLCQHLPPCSAGTLVPPPLSRCFRTRGLCPPQSTPHTVMVTLTHSISLYPRLTLIFECELTFSRGNCICVQLSC